MPTLTNIFTKKSPNGLYKLNNASGSTATLNANSSTETLRPSEPPAKQATSKRPPSNIPTPEQIMNQALMPERPLHLRVENGFMSTPEPEHNPDPFRAQPNMTSGPPRPLDNQPLPSRWIKNGTIKHYDPNQKWWKHLDGSIKKHPPPWEDPNGKEPSVSEVDKASIYKSTELLSGRQEGSGQLHSLGRYHGGNSTSTLNLRKQASGIRSIAPPVPSLRRSPSPRRSAVSSPTTHSDHETGTPFGPEECGRPRKLSVNHVYRYRKQYGMNIDGWFMVDEEITGPLFASEEFYDTELDIMVDYGDAEMRDALEQHYNNWMSDGDFVWLQAHGFNTIRFGIPYWALAGLLGDVDLGQHHRRFHSIYKETWKILLEKVEVARGYGFGVLLVIQEAAGGHNRDRPLSHEVVRMFEPSNSRITITALKELVRQVHEHSNVVGVELLNSPDYDKSFAIQRWYERAVEAMRSVLPPGDADEFPIYIPDAWDPERFARWVGGRQDFVVLDHHVHRAFLGHNQRFRKDWFPEGHDDVINGAFLSKLEGIQRETRGKAIVGEWHSAKAMVEEPSDREIQTVVRMQLNMFRSFCPGNFFSFYKAPRQPGRTSTAQALDSRDLFPGWVGGVGQRAINDISFRDFWKERGAALAIFKAKNPDRSDKERRNIFAIFGDGFAVGWDDAITFATADSTCGVPQLGFRLRWMEKRTAEYRSSFINELSWDGLPEFGLGFGVGYDAATKILLGNGA